MNLSGNILALVLAALSGMLMAVQGALNAVLSKVIGLIETTFIVHVTGTIVLAVAIYILKMGKGNMSLITQAPWYTYLGGVIGVFIVYLVAASIPTVGAGNATTAIIVGQVLTAVAIDCCGAFGLKQYVFGWQKLVGIAFLAIGAKLLIR